MVVDYKSRKKEVLDVYDKVEDLVKQLKCYFKVIELPDPTATSDSLLSDIKNKAEKIKKDKFSLMVAGESKSGKSTFINAYLGEELLPMDVKQCTSAIVEIRCGEEFSVTATYADDRSEDFVGDKAREFLKKNASLDDEYRAIPVPTINSEIIVKSGRRAREKGVDIHICPEEVAKMLKNPEVQSANIYNLPDYNDRIRKYIDEKKSSWKDIVTKIEILYPLDEDLHGIEIIDSPGVCARGGVSDITSDYIKNADAIIFLKPVIGQSLESTQFNQFMENSSADRNKNALFLVLTHIASKNDTDMKRLEEEAYKQFSDKLNKSNILFADSKAELYAKKFKKIEDIKGELHKLKKEGTLDDFVVSAYAETSLFGSGGDFIDKLHEKSRFEQIYRALDTFGRKAHYILLADLLEYISRLCKKLDKEMKERADAFRQKAKDPKEFEDKIRDVKDELEIIQKKMYAGVDNVVKRFNGENGIIRNTANEEVEDFLASVKKIDPNSGNAFNDLEKLSMKKIDRFTELTKILQEQAVAEFDKELVELSDKSSISFISLRPEFTDEIFEEIKRSTESKAYKKESYEEGLTFKTTHYRSVYVQDMHFKAIKDNILSRLEIIKSDLEQILSDFIENIRHKYIAELSKNANAKKIELDAINEAKADAEQAFIIVQNLTEFANLINAQEKNAKEIKGGIENYVQ